MIVLILSFILGLIIGSFLNCVIYRLNKKTSFWKGRSFCPLCRKLLKIKDLVPIFSWLWQRGKCRYCHKKISNQYPLVELITAFLFAFIVWHYQGDTLEQWWWIIRAWIFVSFLIIIFVYDLKHKLILNKVIWPGLAVVVIVNLLIKIWELVNSGLILFSGQFFIFLFHYFIILLIGGAIGLMFFWLQFAISKGRWLGGGDVKLGLLIGLMVGWPQILVVLFISYFIGAITGLSLIISQKKKLKSSLPLGTFLTLGTLISLLWGEQLLGWYMGFL